MTHKRVSRLFAGAIAVSLVAAACGGDDDDASDDPVEAPADDADETDDTEPADDADDTEDTEPADDAEPADDTEPADEGLIDLSSVCPSPLVVQTDWFPESEHGTLYQLMGDDYTVDTEAKVVRGTLVTDGGTVERGIEWEVRTGGPAIGFTPVASYVYTDDSIQLAYQNTESQVLAWDSVPMISVLAPLEINPQIIMWDPETYPDAETLADLGELGVSINVFGGGVFSDVFVAQGIWSADQIDPGYDGTPQKFIAEEGAIAQQGFASAEPHNYEFEFEEWGKPVAFQTLHDAGFEAYSQTIAVRPDRFDELAPCLAEIVPILQQATVDFANDPDRANGIIIDAVEEMADFWVYGWGVAEYAVNAMRELGLTGNGPDDTVGNMEEARIQSVIDVMRDAGMDVPDDLVASDLFTNEFIDESIGF